MNTFCYISTTYGRNPIFAYRRGDGYSFYIKTRHKEEFFKWFKGDKSETKTKMDKFIRESY